MRRNTQRATSIPTEPWEQVSLSRYFMLMAVLLLASMTWALWNETYTRRPWKGYQKRFFEVAQRKYERDRADAQSELASNKYKRLRSAFEAASRRYEGNPKVLQARADIAKIDKKLAGVRGELQLKRGDYQATIYVMEHEKNTAKKDRFMEHVRSLEPDVYRLLEEMQRLQDAKKAQQDKLTELAQEKTAIEQETAEFEERLREAELGLESLQKEVIQVRQVFNRDLKIVDRCQSCHLAVDKKGFDDKNFRQPFRSHPPVFFLPVEEKASASDPKTAEKTKEKPKPTRLRDILSVHPIEQFGCAVCHRGQGMAASSVLDAHGELEFVATPLLRGEMMQATCVKCHTKETELTGAPLLNEGRRTFVEFGCTGCHTVAQLTPEETDRQIAPDLKEIRKKISTPDWLVNWVEEPKKFRPKTKMPHFFLTRQQSTQVAAYLWQNADKPADAPPSESFDRKTIQEGKDLLDSVGCLACHSIDDKGGNGFAADLSRVGEKMRYDYMVSWLMDPKKHQPNGRMPRLRLTQTEASKIAAYLTTKKTAKESSSQVNLDDPKAATEGKRLIERYGCFGCHPIVGMETRSKIGAELSAFGSKSVELLDYGLLEDKVLHKVNLHHARHNMAKARIAWLMQKLHEPRSYDEGRYKQDEDKLRMPKFNFTEKQIRAVTTFVMGLTDEKIVPNFQKQLNEREDAIVKGQRIIRRQNCIGCHQFGLETLSFERKNKTFHMEGRTSADEEGVISFQLWKELRALRQSDDSVKNEPASGVVNVPDAEMRDRILVRTPAWGGDVAQLIIDQFVDKENLDPEEARSYTPPILVGEGTKVQSPWLFEFLKEPFVLRPWFKIRMPSFDLKDDEVSAITRYFALVDGGAYPFRVVPERAPAYIEAQQKRYRNYVDLGLKIANDEAQCGSCHVRGKQTPEGKQPSEWAPDLALTPQRLQPEWVLGWLDNPQALYPGTKMPQFPWGEFETKFAVRQNQQKAIQKEAIKDLLYSGKLAGAPAKSASASTGQ